MLKLVATPIGNLGDMTIRGLEALKAADVIYCEDTRNTLQLLNHFDIKKPLVSCHAHNEESRVREVTEALEAGKEVVYVSDAGMPGISDPGSVLVAACIERGLLYTVLPGASAVLTAAVLSGLPCDDFSFYGFLPREGRFRRETIEKVASCTHLALLYESPHRVTETLKDLYEVMGDRPAAVLRELTKRFETVLRGNLSELAAMTEAEPVRGECVIAVLAEEHRTLRGTAEAASPEQVLQGLLNEGLSVKEAAARAAKQLNMKKSDAYSLALKLRDGE